MKRRAESLLLSDQVGHGRDECPDVLQPAEPVVAARKRLPKTCLGCAPLAAGLYRCTRRLLAGHDGGGPHHLIPRGRVRFRHGSEVALRRPEEGLHPDILVPPEDVAEPTPVFAVAKNRPAQTPRLTRQERVRCQAEVVEIAGRRRRGLSGGKRSADVLDGTIVRGCDDHLESLDSRIKTVEILIRTAPVPQLLP